MSEWLELSETLDRFIAAAGRVHDVAERLRALRTDGWRPVGSEPRDGTPILRPHINWGAMAVRHKRPDQADEFPRGLSWMSSDYSQLWPDEAFLPFWQPLPAPPD